MLSERVDSAQLKELARNGVSTVLRVPVSKLARVSACMYQAGVGETMGGQSELVADVQFDIGPEDFPRIGLSITGQLSLVCQRCLGSVRWPVRIDTRLSVLDSDEQTDLIASPFDSVLIGTDGLDLAVILEDEILAALPMVPIHNNESHCQPASGDDNDSVMDGELTQRPFADLSSLMGDRKSDVDE